jgi:hypothetical protein
VREENLYLGRNIMRAVIVKGMLIGALWFAALPSVKAAVPGQGGMSAAASALSDIIMVKKKGIPAWQIKGRCPPGQWKKGRCY